MRPGDYLKAINYTKEDLFVESQADKDYYPFIINRCLSYFIDTVLYANEMNRFPEILKKDQFNYLKGSVRQRKRFSKWIKKEEEKRVEITEEEVEKEETIHLADTTVLIQGKAATTEDTEEKIQEMVTDMKVLIWC